MNYADIKYPDIQDGTGIRLAIYVSGCHFHCKNCHNKIAWDPNYGKPFTDETIDFIIKKFAENEEYNEGLSLLGGEPLEPYNQEGLLKLTTRFKKEFPNKNVWCWTGYDFDKDILPKMYNESEITRKLLANIDIIVDGTYEEDKNMVDLIARGSYNQKKIDVQNSIKTGKTITLKFGDENRFEGITQKPKVILIKEFSKAEPEVSYVVPTSAYMEELVKQNNESKVFAINKETEKISADSLKTKTDKENT